jgi:starch synthase
MRVVFATAEVSPIAKTGGLGDVCGALPKALKAMGHDPVVFMPFHRQARQWYERTGHPIDVAIPSIQVTWDNWTAETTFYRSTLPGSDVPLLLVGNDYFFDRDHIYASRYGHDDSLERFAYFCRAVIRGCEILDISTDILHCHDWHTALLPVYLHSGLRGSAQFRNARSVYTIHNLNYQGVAPRDRFGFLGLHSRYWAADAIEHFGDINPMKGGILLADEVTTVSQTYAREIQTPQHGAGLDGVLRSVSYRFTGILNGIDVHEWDPSHDTHLAANFEVDKMHGKTISKRMLAKEAGLKYKPRAPMLAVISRLVDQKGFQLLVPVLERLLAAGAQAVILGSGERWLEEALVEIGRRNPGHCRVWIGFDNDLAHRIYAGSDILLMPSFYEPCGLNQMYALRYGTVPVVRLTGGLADTVIPYDGSNRSAATGFGFLATDPEVLYTTAWIAMLNYKDTKLWKALQHNGMTEDNSWEHSAKLYDQVYRRAAG